MPLLFRSCCVILQKTCSSGSSGSGKTKDEDSGKAWHTRVNDVAAPVTNRRPAKFAEAAASRNNFACIRLLSQLSMQDSGLWNDHE